MTVVISGTPTTATLELSNEASGPAMLLIGHAPLGGAPQSEVAAVAPGATASVEITPVGFGMMRVHVDMSDEADGGVLTVSAGELEPEAIEGDTNVPLLVVETEG